MITSERMSADSSQQSDTALVSQALSGDRGAFGQIVARYQSLICSMAYSATGNLSQSEDLAQDTFITAWKQLPHLREQGKLRAWLCGIARFVIGKAVRKDGREPSHAAESLDIISHASTPEAQPGEHAMSKEEEAILWRSIERIPETYREPLVLFYREHKSVEAVAEALELSEDTVKQRLSRGRKLLQQEVLAFVEGALARTAPGKGFTLGVLAAIPAFLLPAQAAAAVGSVAIGGSGKAAAGSGLLGAWMAPVLAVFGTWVGYRLDLDAATTDVERRFTKTFYGRLTGALLAFIVGTAFLVYFASRAVPAYAGLLRGAFVVLTGAYTVFVVGLLVWMRQARRRAVAQLISDRAAASRPVWEYRSRRAFLGLPLVHAKIGGGLLTQKDPVKAWIAIGDTAIGGLFAFGGVAVAPVSIGGCAIGLLPFGGMAAGVAALGGLALGVWSFGGLALGWQAFGSCAIAWQTAAGGIAIAHDYALGGTAHAIQANNEVARLFVQHEGFFRGAVHVFRYHLAWINLIWVLPMIAWWRATKRANQPAAA
jgi:RNA polymerase sigma factor (sigma-70 family)